MKLKTLYKTILRAEDGTYTDIFKSYKDAYEYVTHQMGDDPSIRSAYDGISEPYLGGWTDDSGRSMWIEKV